MVAWSVVLETNVVALTKLFHRTDEDALKFVPVSVNVKLVLLAVVDVGEREVRVGAGLLIVSVSRLRFPALGPDLRP